MARLSADALRVHLESLYSRYNRRDYIHPDPLSPVLRFERPDDLEVAGLIAAILAFGNVKHILNSVERVLHQFPEPARQLRTLSVRQVASRLRGFRHRFIDEHELAEMLHGARRLLHEHGSLEACFMTGVASGAEDVHAALVDFVSALRAEASLPANYALPSPEKGGASKRLHMYLRWMIRRDAVDPGPWRGVPPRLLIVPIDTHMHHIGQRLGFTRRKTADLKTALEITRRFRRIAPDDPVRYDFCLTRLGIRTDTDLEGFLKACRSPGAPPG